MSGPDPGNREIVDQLRAILGRAKELGLLGPGPIEAHVERAMDLARAAMQPTNAHAASTGNPSARAPDRALDLGSGGGVPGLPLALLWQESEWVLLDGSIKRANFLQAAVEQLGISHRVSVVADRAEAAARQSGLRQSFDLVTARGFGSPAVTAECSSPFLRPGGVLVVAEPPGGDPSRWDPSGLDKLGMSVGRAVDSPTACQTLIQVEPCPDRYPRRVGIPAKRPLW